MEAGAALSVAVGICDMVCSHVGGSGRTKLEADLDSNLQDHIKSPLSTTRPCVLKIP